jgi:hypothetical protein
VSDSILNYLYITGCIEVVMKVIYLKVSYSDKEQAKKFGAKWDPDQKLWYIVGSDKVKLLQLYNYLDPAIQQLVLTNLSNINLSAYEQYMPSYAERKHPIPKPPKLVEQKTNKWTTGSKPTDKLDAQSRAILRSKQPDLVDSDIPY